MKINREILQQKLFLYSRKANGLIVGSPGVGKTFCILQLAKELKEKGIPYLMIPVDRLGNATSSEISSAFKITESLSEKLKKTHFDTKNPGVVLIDGFDAARSLEGQENLLNLMKDLLSTLKGGWNILVSVRSFDARKSRELMKLFPNSGVLTEESYQDTSITGRHFYIPPLSKDEITALDWQIEGLKNLYEQGSEELNEILSIPFNLWLLEGLKKNNRQRVDINSISSETELLGLFWSEYVSSGSNSENKEHILRALTKTMVVSYSLSTKKEEVYSPATLEAWKELFSNEILVESSFSGQRISFSHNILFDFAVSVLLIDEKVDQLIEFMVQDPARTLFLRPSLTYFYTRLWFYNQDLFWNSFWSILSSEDANLRLFSRIVPSAVIARHVSKNEDFNNLLNPPKQFEAVAKDSIVRVFQAHDFIDNSKDEVWLYLIDKLSEKPNKEYLWFMARLAVQILNKSLANENTGLVIHCGVIGRRIFNWIWEERKTSASKGWIDGIGADLVLQIILKTYSSNPGESKIIVDSVLNLVKEKNFPIMYLYRLTDHISFIWEHHPEQVEAIYRTLFSYQENSKEVTSFGTPILPMLSNRKQDFDMCHYKLIKKFPDFLNAKPINAIKAAIDCIDAYAWQRKVLRYADKEISLDDAIKKFSFRGGQSSYLPDYSYVWDASGGHKDEPIKMADCVFNYLDKKIDDLDAVSLIVDIFAKRAIAAFWWKRLLMFGEKHADLFYDLFFELCLNESILDGVDTEFYSVRFIEASWSHYSAAQREQIENAVMNISSDNENRQKYILRLKEKIIGRIPKEHLTRPDSIKIKLSIDEKGEVPSNNVPYKMEVGWGPYSEDDDLIEQGIDIAEPNIATLKQLWKPLSTMTSASLNDIPNESSAAEFLLKMKLLHSALVGTAVTEVAVLNQAWTELARAAAIVARSNLTFNSEEFKFVEQILLVCSEHSSPEPYPDADKSYTTASYSQAPRTEAAQGLCWLARLGESQPMLEAIKVLSVDAVPSVRYLTLREVWRAKDVSAEFVWNILEASANSEKNQVVLGAISNSVGYFLPIDEDRAAKIVDIIFNKLLLDNDRSENSKVIIDIITWLFLERNNQWATEKINEISSSPVEYINVIYKLVHNFINYVIPKNLEKKADLFDKATTQISVIVLSLWREIGNLYSNSNEQPWSEESKELLKDLYAPIDDIITRVYFAADVNSDLRDGKVAVLTDVQRKLYFMKVKGLLQLILDQSLNSKGGALFAPTTHYFMQLLNGVLQYDVASVLKMAADLNKFSEANGYVIDSMAMEEVVSLTEQVLADHRSELRKTENIENLLKLLDVFAKTGWADALRLVWRLDEIYR